MLTRFAEGMDIDVIVVMSALCSSSRLFDFGNFQLLEELVKFCGVI